MTLWLGRRDFFPRLKVTLSAEHILSFGVRSDLVVHIELVNVSRRMVKIKSVGVTAAGPRFRRRKGRNFAWVGMETNKPLPTRLEPHDSCEHWTRAIDFFDDMVGNHGFEGTVLFCGYAVDVEGRVHRSKFISIDFDKLPGDAESASEEGRGPIIFG